MLSVFANGMINKGIPISYRLFSFNYPDKDEFSIAEYQVVDPRKSKKKSIFIEHMYVEFWMQFI